MSQLDANKKIQPHAAPVAAPLASAQASASSAQKAASSSPMLVDSRTLGDDALRMWDADNGVWTPSRIIVGGRACQALVGNGGQWAIVPQLRDANNMPSGQWEICKRMPASTESPVVWKKAAELETMYGKDVWINGEYRPAKPFLTAYETKPVWRPRHAPFAVQIDSAANLGAGTANVLKVTVTSDTAGKPVDGVLKVAQRDDAALRHGTEAAKLISLRNPDARISKVLISGFDARIPGASDAGFHYYAVDKRVRGKTLDDAYTDREIQGVSVSHENTKQHATMVAAISESVMSLNQVKTSTGQVVPAPEGQQVVCSDIKPDNFIISLSDGVRKSSLPVQAVLIDKDALYAQQRSEETRLEQMNGGTRCNPDFAGKGVERYPGATADDPCFHSTSVDRYHLFQVAKIALIRWQDCKPALTPGYADSTARAAGDDPTKLTAGARASLASLELMTSGYNARWIAQIRSTHKPAQGSADARMLSAIERALGENPQTLDEFRSEMAAIGGVTTRR